MSRDPAPVQSARSRRSRRASITTELIAVVIGVGALAIPLTSIASDRSALVRLDRRAANLELLQNALDQARHGAIPPLPSGWSCRIVAEAGGLDSVTITGPGGVSATTLRRSRP